MIAEDGPETATHERTEVDSFWELARVHAKLTSMPAYFGPTTLEVVQPPAWSFGGTPEQADELLALVLDGTKTATASALWDYEADGAAIPTVGELSIVVDGAGHPHALIATTDVRVVPFDEVDEQHARAEGEADRTLAAWREAHRRFFSEHASSGRPFSPDMPVVLERFKVLYVRESA